MELIAAYQNQIIIWFALGLCAGVIAKYLLPGKDKGGLLSTVFLGIGGSFLGGALASYFDLGGGTLASGLSFTTFITAIAGAFILLISFRVLKFLI